MKNIRHQKEKFLKHTLLHLLSYNEYTPLCGTRCKAYTNTCINDMRQCTERSVVITRHYAHFTRKSMTSMIAMNCDAYTSSCETRCGAYTPSCGTRRDAYASSCGTAYDVYSPLYGLMCNDYTSLCGYSSVIE